LVIDPDLAIFTFLVFVFLLVVLKKFAWGPIIQSLEAREHNIAEHIAQAERNHQEAKKVLAQYEQRLAAAALEVRELLEEARRDAEKTKQSILAEAKSSAEAERARALRDIEAAADQAMESLARHSAQLAVDLAGRILQTKLSKDDHARLIQEAMAKFPANASAN
jgi:F-type H+-transporting ATPase subunit b